MFGRMSEPRRLRLRRWASSGSSGRPEDPQRVEAFACGGIEPTVDDLLDDPVTGAIMAYDHVSPAAVRLLMAQMRDRLLQHRPA